MEYAAPLGLLGGFLDAIGGGGWGALVASTLIGSGHAPRNVIGSVNAAEFFVTTAVATTFFIELGTAHVEHIAALIIGGVMAAPLGAYVARRVPAMYSWAWSACSSVLSRYSNLSNRSAEPEPARPWQRVPAIPLSLKVNTRCPPCAGHGSPHWTWPTSPSGHSRRGRRRPVVA